MDLSAVRGQAVQHNLCHKSQSRIPALQVVLLLHRTLRLVAPLWVYPSASRLLRPHPSGARRWSWVDSSSRDDAITLTHHLNQTPAIRVRAIWFVAVICSPLTRLPNKPRVIFFYSTQMPTA